MRILLFITLLLPAGLIIGQYKGLALDDPEWAGVQAYPVKGMYSLFKKAGLSFGPFHTLEADRSWTIHSSSAIELAQEDATSGRESNLVAWEKSKQKNRLYFQLGDTRGGSFRAFCANEFNAKDFNIGKSNSLFNLALDLLGPGYTSTNIFFSRIIDDATSEGWTLLLDSQAAMLEPETYQAFLSRDDETYYTIQPASRIVINAKGKIGSLPFGAAGFMIRRNTGEAVAAVSIMDNGIIYLMDVPAKEQLLLATLCTALLLRPSPFQESGD